MGIATIPAGWFPKQVPWAIASELLLQAERVSAERAYQVGIVNKVVPARDLMAEAEKVAQRIAGLSPVAVQGMKESMVRAFAIDHQPIDAITGRGPDESDELGRSQRKARSRSRIGERSTGQGNESRGARARPVLLALSRLE